MEETPKLDHTVPEQNRTDVVECQAGVHPVKSDTTTRDWAGGNPHKETQICPAGWQGG